MNKVVDTIAIEKLEGGAFNVVQGNRYSDTLSYDEMLGLVSALTIAKEPNCLRWMQTKEEHEAQFNSLKKATEDITEVEFEDILVPEKISLFALPNGDYGGYGDGLFIGFNEEKQLLGFSDTTYCVEPRNKCRLDKVLCKLIPCNREDLRPGDTAFADLLNNIGHNTSYCKVLDDERIVYPTSDHGASITEWKGFNMQWYKVVAL